MGSVWVVDLTELPIFHGLSVLSRALGEMVVAQAQSDRIDINIERQLRQNENPELLQQFGITLVKLCAEQETIAPIAAHPELFQDHLRTLFGTLQRPRFRDCLFPQAGRESLALVFMFEFPELMCRFVLERVSSPRNPDRCFLRVTIEDPQGRRLALESVPHVLVEDIGRRSFIAGSTRIAVTLSEGIHREAERGRRSFIEARSPHNHMFRQLQKAGLEHFEQVHVSWGGSFLPWLLESEPRRLDHLMKRVMLVLEDREMRRLLDEKETIRIDADDVPVYLDTSQLSRVLEISLGRRRQRTDIDHFLDRMPRLSQLVGAALEKPGSDAPLADISVFLVHHMTAEVLGTIAALRRLGCRDLVCLFVAYAGDPPGSYLAPLLDLPTDEFTALALTNVPEEGSVEGHYRLSRLYSTLDNEAELAAALAPHAGDFFDAMKVVARSEFLRQVDRAGAAGRRCLLIEDGGYVAPFVSHDCTTGNGELSASIADVLLGSVEHTRNGFDRLKEVERNGGVAWPVFSIAVSRHKTEIESTEVAASVLNAVENVLHAGGRILSRRSCVVLGARGAIGSRLMRALGARLDDRSRQLHGIDLAAAEGDGEARSWSALPDAARNDCDLIIGVTGRSVLEGSELAHWLLHGGPTELFLASGSTKTIEFADLARWLDGLLEDADARIGDVGVRVSSYELSDPLTERVLGHRFKVSFTDGERPDREVVLLANSMPVNFLFYGVSTELIDEVLTQLVSTSLGLVRRLAAGEKLAKRVHAVDVDIDEHGDDLPVS